MIITSETPVRDIAVELPTAIPALGRLGIDFCCGGQHTLAEACAKLDLNLAPVLEELERQQQQNVKPSDTQWLQTSLKELSGYIVEKHHAYTRDQLKLIDGLMTKVEQRHGADHPEVFQVSKVYAVISSELTHHFDCEETTLFPYIAALGTEEQPELPAMAKNSMERPITRMMMDHDQAGDELRTLRKLIWCDPSIAANRWGGFCFCLS
ncbi:MAG: DUF542 domain-containing protein, partial [Silvibacterium sp.]